MPWAPDPQFAGTLLRRKTSPAYYKQSVGCRLSRWRRHKLCRLSEAQNHRCAYCGKHTHFGDSDCLDRATLEHLIPVCKSVQTNKDENLIMACAHCNSIRSNMDPMKFYKKIRCKPLSPMLAKREPKLSNNPEKRAHQKVKQGRLLKMCWIIVCFWPANGQAIVEYSPKRDIRTNYDQHINDIRTQLQGASFDSLES